MKIGRGLPPIEHLLALPPVVSLSLVVSLDGQLRGPDGSSRSISGAEDLEWLRRLRASSDAIVVGAATAAVEDYKPIRVRPEYAEARRDAGLSAHPELVVIHRNDDFPQLRRRLGPRVLLEAGVRLHRALAADIDRIWISHSPVITGDQGAALALTLQEFRLEERWVGARFVFSRFERFSQR